MRISDWSSDVCSSDPGRQRAKLLGLRQCRLHRGEALGDRIELLAVACQFEQRLGVSPCQACLITAGILHAPCFLQFDLPVIKDGEEASTPRMPCAPVSRGVPAMQDRTSVVEGKSGSVRVELGGRGTNKKHKKK